jgi:Tol biopolymer transport system component
MKVIEIWCVRLARLALQTIAAVVLLLTLSSSGAAPMQLLSTRNLNVSLPAGGNGNSASPTMSSDGRFVLFVSAANNLVPGGDSQFSMNLFLRDRASNTTVLVSVNTNGTGGANGDLMSGTISTNGRWALIESDASNLVSADTNEFTDIFVRDLQIGSNTLVSVAMDGGSANGASSGAVLTPDGRYVVFTSDATNLVSGDSNGIPDTFVRDLLNQTTTLVSVGAVKSSLTVFGAVMPTGPAAITPDGRYVAFFTTARGLVAGVPSGSAGEVYLRDLVASNTVWASSNNASQTFAGHTYYMSYHPAISDDGRFVAYKTSAYDGTTSAAILRYDSISNSLLLVTTNALPQLFNDDVYGPEMTPDGRFIAFVKGFPATNPAVSSSIYLADAQIGTNILVSVRQDGTFPTNSNSDTPVLSPDGRFVAFVSNATNLVGNAISNGFHLYLRDVIAETTTLVDAGTNGVGLADEYGASPALTPDGRWIAFAGSDGNLVSNDQNQALDVFMRDVMGGTNELISQRDATIIPATGSGLSYAAQLSITPNGRWVVFSSRANDLVTNDFSQDQDIFVRDLTLGSTTLASVGLDNNSAAGGFSSGPVISSNGQFVAFTSTATNLVANYINAFGDIFKRDLIAGTNALISVSADGVNPGNGSSSAPAMSPDGRYIAFLSTATNLVSPSTPSGRMNTFWRDTALGVTIAVSTNGAGLFPPSMSADGRYVAYSYSPGNTVAVWDSQTLTNIYVAPSSSASVASAVISPTGAQLLYRSNNAVKVSDLVLKSNVFSMGSSNSICSPAQWSADGRFFTFVSRSNFVVGPFTNNQIYLGDLVARTVALVSSTPDHSTGGNGASDSPTLSANGRFIVYRSSATDIASGTIPGSSLVLYDRATGSNTVLNSVAAGAEWSARVSRPLMDAAGQTVTFQSVQSGLAPGDLNRAPDIFVTQPEVTADSDGDGIPDWWMIKYFGHATGLAGDHSLPQDDADNDGFSNLQEFLAGTGPLDSQSFLLVQIFPPDSVSNTATLSWPSVPGKSYQVQYKANLDDPAWSNFGTAIVAKGSISITVSLTSSTGFYRVIAIN